MLVIDPGHLYELAHLDGDDTTTLRFVKRVGDNYPGNEAPPYQGVTSQEVLRALIDRMKYVSDQQWWTENQQAVEDLRSALYYLEQRAARARNELSLFESQLENNMHTIESIPVCKECGHIGCGRHVSVP